MRAAALCHGTMLSCSKVTASVGQVMFSSRTGPAREREAPASERVVAVELLDVRR
jgi:hypothetical protein